MAKLLLVRHGEAAASWDKDKDPGLSKDGAQQAQRCADALAQLSPCQVLSSPLKRTQETAAPLLAAWQLPLQLASEVAELPSQEMDLTTRSSWLREIMGQRWDQQQPWLLQWRQTLIDFLQNLEQDSIIFTHFVAINAVTSIASDANILQFSPDYTSITTLDNSHGLKLVSLGVSAETFVN